MTRSAAALGSLGSLALALACAGGEGGDRPPTTIGVDTDASTGTTMSTGDAESGDDESPMSCVPGQQIACPCPGGTEGAQACNATGTGYEPCECPGDDTESTEGTDGTSTSVDPSETDHGDTGMVGDCEFQRLCEDCVSCEISVSCKEEYEFCSTDAACSQASECTMSCGFTLECAMLCGPEPGSEGDEPFQSLILCLGNACPQCL